MGCEEAVLRDSMVKGGFLAMGWLSSLSRVLVPSVFGWDTGTGGSVVRHRISNGIWGRGDTTLCGEAGRDHSKTGGRDIQNSTRICHRVPARSPAGPGAVVWGEGTLSPMGPHPHSSPSPQVP